MLYLLLAICSSAMVSILMRLSESKIRNNTGMLCMNYLMCILLGWGYAGADWFPGVQGLDRAVTLGCLNGVLYLASFVLLQINVRKNGVVLSSTFMKLGLLVTMAVSVCFFGEMPGPVQAAGFFLAVAAIVLINYRSGNRNGAGSAWLLVALLVGGGMADAMSKIFEELGNPALADHFLLYTFAVAFLCCVCLNTGGKKGWPGKWEILFGLSIGIPNFFSSKFLLRALEDIAAVIVYPVYSVAGILLVTMAGVIFFKERLTKRQWLALGLILAALVLLNL